MAPRSPGYSRLRGHASVELRSRADPPMLRNALLWASTNRYLAQRLPSYGFVKRATRRFMPGETVEDAITEALTLEAHGIRTSFTLLGENVETDEQADAVAEHYLGVLARVREQGL